MTFKEVKAFLGTRPQRITGYQRLDVFGVKKTQRGCPKGLAFGSALVAWAAAEVDVGAVGAVVVAAVGAAEVVDGLSGEGFGGESGTGDDDLAVFIAKSGVGGLESGHF
jgi:hypothetical protein